MGMPEYLPLLFAREISTLRREVELYPDDDLLWKEVPGCPNSGGHLALHLVGTLRHFIGAQMGGSGYVRDRDAEFATRTGEKASLLREIDRAAAEVDKALSELTPAQLDEWVILAAYGSLKRELWLLHLHVHLAYHLGQLDYHRRAVTGSREGAEALPIKVLIGR
jgi:uncharacterized damage-inducible protein DinB